MTHNQNLILTAVTALALATTITFVNAAPPPAARIAPPATNPSTQPATQPKPSPPTSPTA